MSHAANALKAFESGDLDGALKELSELWQESRAPEAADALELVAAKAAPPRAPPWKTVAERDAAWRALEGTLRPAVLGPLLETLFDVPTKWVRARLDLLDSRWPADPRAARSLVHIMQTTYARGATSYHLWKKLCEMIARQADPRVLPALEKLDVAHRGSQPVAITAALNRTNLFAKTAHLIRQQLRSFALPLTADEQAVISTIRAAFAAHREHSVSRAKTADDFLAEIYENPGDDQLRQVFADWLLEQGDPRGEFINLQLAKTKTTASRRREATLLRELGRRWLGALEPVVLKDGVVFERGFPAALRLRVKSLRVAKEIVGRPEWSTVRWLDVRGWAYGSLPALLLSPVMRSLRAVHGCGLAMLSIDGPVAWEELGIDGDASRMYRIESLDGFRATKAFPEVRSLHLVDVIVDPEQARPLWTSEFGRRLKSFDLRLFEGWQAETPVELAPRWLVEVGAGNTPLERIAISWRGGRGWSFVLDRALARLSGRFGKEAHTMAPLDIGAIVSALPWLREVEIRAALPPAEITSLRTLAQMRGITLTLDAP